MALIISNPGEVGDEHYCAGVNKDVTHYQEFLKADYGGFWYDGEIDRLPRPTASEVRLALTKLRYVDYSLVIFSGHGYYSSLYRSTILELKKGEQIDSAELRNASSKQTIILDCCRKVYPPVRIEEHLLKAYAAKPRRDAERCRRLYDEQIVRCGSSMVIAYSCATGEGAGDDSQTGGIYSFNLLYGCRRWAEDSTVGFPVEAQTLSIVAAHNLTASVVTRLRAQQHPEIERDRSGAYFPFCVVA
jgi:hypothetical protein